MATIKSQTIDIIEEILKQDKRFYRSSEFYFPIHKNGYSTHQGAVLRHYLRDHGYVTVRVADLNKGFFLGMPNDLKSTNTIILKQQEYLRYKKIVAPKCTKMEWVKLTKHYQGGEKTDYMLVEAERVETHSSQQELMEEWGENSDGGHNYGYRVDMEILNDGEIPPQEWLQKAVRRTADAIEHLQSKTVRTTEELQMLKNLLR